MRKPTAYIAGNAKMRFEKYIDTFIQKINFV